MYIGKEQTVAQFGKAGQLDQEETAGETTLLRGKEQPLSLLLRQQKLPFSQGL